jgi:hypothetical protein
VTGNPGPAASGACPRSAAGYHQQGDVSAQLGKHVLRWIDGNHSQPPRQYGGGELTGARADVDHCAGRWLGLAGGAGPQWQIDWPHLV